MAESGAPFEFDFPVVDYYKGHILDGHTLARTGVWWTAILLLEDQRTKKPFIGLYRWQKTKNGWKTRKRFSFHRTEEVNEVAGILQKFSTRLSPNAPASEDHQEAP